MHRRKEFIFFYMLLDSLASLIAWMALYFFRKYYIEHFKTDIDTTFNDPNFFVGLIIIPQIWVLLHYFTGSYVDVFRKSRLQELLKTIGVSLLGTIIIFFAFMLDDLVKGYKDYYLTFLTLFIAQTFFTILLRFSFLNYTKHLLKAGKVGFNTLVIGSTSKVEEVLSIISNDKNSGFILKGIAFNDGTKNTKSYTVPVVSLDDLDYYIEEEQIEEVILAVDTEQHGSLMKLMHSIGDHNVFMKIVPDMYDILSRTVKMNHIIGEAFIEIPPVLIDEWERIGKRWFDVIASSVAILITFPIWLFVMILIKLDSEGTVFYMQERLGQYGKPFFIMKFRSMRNDAESTGPKLTANHDPRITRIGLWMRKYRVDELPQFLNVIKGDMSIVGPRAERKFFAKQIESIVPQYTYIFKVKPGITSLGMVKYGYASTVEEMVKRLRYDLIYIENMSIVMDFKILIYTVKTVLYGKGK